MVVHRLDAGFGLDGAFWVWYGSLMNSVALDSSVLRNIADLIDALDKAHADGLRLDRSTSLRLDEGAEGLYIGELVLEYDGYYFDGHGSEASQF